MHHQLSEPLCVGYSAADRLCTFLCGSAGVRCGLVVVGVHASSLFAGFKVHAHLAQGLISIFPAVVATILGMIRVLFTLQLLHHGQLRSKFTTTSCRRE